MLRVSDNREITSFLIGISNVLFFSKSVRLLTDEDMISGQDV